MNPVQANYLMESLMYFSLYFSENTVLIVPYIAETRCVIIIYSFNVTKTVVIIGDYCYEFIN